MIKKIILSICLIHAITVIFSQSNVFPSDGNVGIGNIAPSSRLQIVEPTGSKTSGIIAPTKTILKLSRSGTYNYSYPESAEFRIGHGGSYVWGTQLDLFVNGASNQNDIPDQQVMTWLYNGNVGIGITTPSEKLSVNGNIRSKKLIVTQTGWSDYVFDSSYQLKPLTELEKFIKINKHLPDVPSAKQVENDGIDVGENQAVLLKKIEELTLYLLEHDKQMKILKEENDVRQKKNEKEIQKLMAKIEEQQTEIDQLKKLK